MGGGRRARDDITRWDCSRFDGRQTRKYTDAAITGKSSASGRAAEGASITIQQFTLGELQSNCFLIHDAGHAVVIDPGGDPATLIDYCTAHSVVPEIVLATHGHFDHVGGVAEVVERYGIPFAVSSLDAPHYQDVVVQARLFGCSDVSQPPEPLIDLAERVSVTVAGFEIGILATPGHSEGSVTFVLGDHLFVGDVLFQLSIGRTDLPGGDMATLIKSIHERLFPLENGIVYPGHGPSTTIREEQAGNPFLTGDPPTS